jgi:hypothetical protein
MSNATEYKHTELADANVPPEEDGHAVTAAPFETREIDVTDTCCQVVCCLSCPIHWLPLIPGIMGTKKLVLEPEEAVMTTECCGVCDISTRRPYGELGSVDQCNFLCCVGVSSNLSKGMPLFVGSGCNEAVVADIVNEMKTRMKMRGDTGQIRRAELLQTQMRDLRADVQHLQACVNMLLQDRGLTPPQAQQMQ